MQAAYRLLYFALLFINTSVLAQSQSPDHSQASFPIRIGTDSAFAGEMFRLPIILNDVASVMAQGATLVGIQCSYNTTVLEPLPDPAINRDVPGRLFIGITLDASMDTIIGYIPFRAGLGNSPTSGLNFESATTNSANAQLAATNGLFVLRGVCYEGGPRLINPSGTPLIITQKPLITDSHFAVEVRTIEEGATKLYLFDMLGRKAKVFFDEYTLPASRKMTLDVGDISNGKYLLVLETPTKLITQTLEVVR